MKDGGARLLRIASRARTREEFISIFRRFCDHASVFVITREPQELQSRLRLSITLAGGQAMLQGEVEVLEHFSTSDNRFGAPGMRLGFVAADDATRALLELFASDQHDELAAEPGRGPPLPRHLRPPARPGTVPPKAEHLATLATLTTAEPVHAIEEPEDAPTAERAPGRHPPSQAPTHNHGLASTASSQSPIDNRNEASFADAPRRDQSRETSASSSQPPLQAAPNHTVPLPVQLEPTELVPTLSAARLTRRRTLPLALAALAALLTLAVIVALSRSGDEPAVRGGVESAAVATEPAHAADSAPPTTPPPPTAATVAPVIAGDAPAARAPASGAVATGEATGDPAARDLDQQTCSLRVRTSPKGVRVSVAGKRVGETPLLAELPCGPHRLQLSHPRYQDTTRELDLTPGARGELSLRLSRPTFVLRIVSTPKGATVMIDGSKAGVTPLRTPIRGFERASVVVKKSGYASHRTNIYVKSDEHVVRVRLRPSR